VDARDVSQQTVRGRGSRTGPRLLDVSPDTDAFLAFRTELAARVDRSPRSSVEPPRRRLRLRWLLVPLIVAPVATGIVAWVRLPKSQAAAISTPAPRAESFVTIRSHPEGARVLIDGSPRGVTPLRLALPVGNHTVELASGSAKRSLPLEIEAGVAATQYVELQSAAAAPAAVGRLDVVSEPAGASVTVDGVVRGKAPMTLADIAVGQHTVMLTSRSGTFSRTVTIAPGATATVVASLGAERVSVGWVVVDSPLELQIFQDGRRLGTGLDRIMVPAGLHVLDLVNEQYGYRTRTSVEVGSGRTTTAKIDVPLGRVSVNATPWAEVQIDGRAAGMTPLANLSMPIGLHEIVWRHPQFGQRRQVISVTASQPVRIGMDFSK
jgi:hypothetical protein